MSLENIDRRKLVKNTLDSLLRKYKNDKLSNLDNPENHHIRVNVMLVGKEYETIWKRYLPTSEPDEEYLKFIAYRGDVPPDDRNYKEGYTKLELNQQYEEGEACCGMALEENSWMTYNAEDSACIDESMTGEAQRATADIKSILSVPIYHPDDEDRESPIGMVNIDSKNLMSETGLNTHSVLELVGSGAETIGSLVKRR